LKDDVLEEMLQLLDEFGSMGLDRFYDNAADGNGKRMRHTLHHLYRNVLRRGLQPVDRSDVDAAELGEPLLRVALSLPQPSNVLRNGVPKSHAISPGSS
jgi:hypothetical protein